MRGCSTAMRSASCPRPSSAAGSIRRSRRSGWRRRRASASSSRPIRTSGCANCCSNPTSTRWRAPTRRAPPGRRWRRSPRRRRGRSNCSTPSCRSVGEARRSARCCSPTASCSASSRSRGGPRAGRRAAARAFIEGLAEGQYVVHIEHGVGIYRGLITLNTSGAAREYLLIEYAGADKLYVPVDQTDRVAPFQAGGTDPTVHKLGGGEWARTKSRVKKAVLDLADDLIKLYAARETAIRPSYGEDSPWDNALADSFPYEETVDQRRAIGEVTRDLEASEPMDRLLVRRCRLRQDGGCAARRLQGRQCGEAGRHPRADDRACAAALPDLPPAPRRLPDSYRDALAAPHRPRE